jgi:hypothetical protein
MKVDPVEQGAGNARLVVGGAFGRAAASQRWIAQMAAAARVHRRDQLDPRGERDVGIGSRDRHFAGFERLAQRIERAALEFGQFVEEQHAQMREAHLAGPHAQAPAGERGHRGRMVRAAIGPRAADLSVLQHPRDRGHQRGFERLARREVGQDARQARGHQRLARAGRADQQHG